MASEPMSSPFGGSQSTVSSPSSDQTTPSPASAAIERLRSTLPTEEAAKPAYVPTPKHRLHFPNLSSPRPSSKAKRSTGVLTLLRKPKPKWDDLKSKLRKRHKDHASDASEGLESVSEQQDGDFAEANGHGEGDLKEEGSQLESQESMMPDVLKPGQDLHVQVVSAKSLRAADSNGLSDPYTVVHLGSRTDQTRVIQENLNPEWHETFVYSAEDIQAALMDHMSSMLFEVWDSDFGLIADDFLGQAEFSLLDFKATDESTRVELPLYIEVKGQRISSGCGSLTLLVWVTEKDAESAEDAPTIVSTVCPTPNAVPKQLPSLVHDERGNTLYEEPSIAWMHVRISQVALVRHDREEDGLRALAKIFAPPGSRSRSRWKRWSLSRGSDSRSSSFTEEPQMRETLKPDPSFKERRNLRRVISDDKESSSGKDDRGKLKTVKRKVVQLFGMADKEEENQAADFEDDDALDALEQEDEERAEAEEQGKEGEDDLDKEKLLYWEVSVGSQQHRSRLAPLSGTRSMAQWDQDFAFAVVLPLKTRPLMLELHESKGGRRKGRPIARAYIPLADLFSNGKSDFGTNVEWFKLHDVDRRASGELEAAVSLAAACVDIDKRRAIYDLPLAVALEKRITKGHLEKISGQKSEASFSSQRRPHETSEVTQEPPGEQEPPSGPRSFKEKFVDKLKSLSLMPSPNQALETFKEDSGGEMAAARSGKLSSPLHSKDESASQPAEGTSASHPGPPEAAQEVQPLLSQESIDNFSAKAAAEQPAPAGEGGPEQALQEESAKGDAGDLDAGSGGRAVAEPLSWSTRIASKLFIQRPKWEKPAPPQALGVVQLLIKEVELDTSETCFLLLRCGAQWGRSITLPSSKTHNFNWEIHMPVLEPSTVLQLALFKETGPRGTRKSVMAGLLRLRLNSLTSEVDHSAELPMCASRKQGGEKVATLGLSIKVSYFNSWRLLRTYILPVTPLGVFKHGLNKGDVKKNLERETNCIVMRWLETSNPPVARAVAEVLIRSPQDTFAMSRVKANWRRIATWFDGFKKAGEGWKYLQSWENPAATIGTMGALSGICCFPHVMVSLALTGLVIFMIAAYPKEDVGKPLPMEPDPEADEDDDDEDNELQGTLVTRLQRRVDGMQKIALKVQNVLDDVASILERCRGLVCWADPNASAFFLLIATSWALGVAVLGLHTILSALLCWMLRPPFLRVLKPPPPVSFVGRLPTKADQIT